MANITQKETYSKIDLMLVWKCSFPHNIHTQSVPVDAVAGRVFILAAAAGELKVHCWGIVAAGLTIKQSYQFIT